MIIEDEKDLCFLLCTALKNNNIKTQCAHSISEAKRTINDIQPSIVFLDNNLPDGQGPDFIPVVKRNFPLAKIIMITAYDSSSDIKSAFTLGADYFISKPFNTSAINNVLAMVHTHDFKKAI